MKFKKILCCILAVLMLCSMLSAFAYADETDDATAETVEGETDSEATEGESEDGEDGEIPKNEEIIITEEGMTGDGTTGDPAHLATYTLASENKNLAFYVNDITGFFALVNKKTNDIWFSNPVDWEKDMVAQASNREQLQSQLVVTYLNASYDILTIPSTEAHIVSEHKDNKQIFTYVFSGATRNFSIPVCFARESLVLFIVTFMLRSVTLGIIGVLSFTFTPDCAEYGQYTTGTEAKGITFAIQTFAVKLAAAISGSLGLALLGFFGFKTFEGVDSFEALEAINARDQQTAEAIDGLWFTYNAVPIIGLVIALVIWHFYKLNDKDVQVMADYNVGKITKVEAEDKLSRKY